jgi:ribosomal peptide maturation radical SAM protein 1
MDVVFAVMPFADIGRPAIGVSLLKAAAARAGFSSIVQYYCMQLADLMGYEVYQKVSSSFAPDLLVGEWFFAGDLFGDEIPADDEYLDKILSRSAPPEIIESIQKARKVRSQYLDSAAQHIAGMSPAIVGFTTTFHQTCASMAVARRLKAMPNPPVIVFGGANCEGEMGLQMLESFPWIDWICSGESDISFVKLLHHLLRNGPGDIPGVLERERSTVPAVSEAIKDMDALPYPDYDDYFRQLEEAKCGAEAGRQIIVETSRGCWWGAKHHCTFCGLNGETMAFRSKSPARAFEEIDFLSRRYGSPKVGCVDNILDMRYLDTLFPMLAASGLELDLFYEVKANLRFDQLVKMRRGGLKQIQPGIESFSNQVLRLMDKGVSGFQNIQLMRWCEETGIDCAWNLLAGFPGESTAEYERMAELIPLLTHLNPPCSCAQIRLDRFSPFHFRSDTFGFRNLRPARAYYFVFPLGRRELMRLAYFFDFDYGDGRQVQAYLEPVQRRVQEWWDGRMAGESRPRLDAYFEEDRILVTDTRPPGRSAQYHLTGLRARLFVLCDSASTAPALARQLRMDEAEVQDALESLVDDGLLARDDGQFLTLAVFRNRPAALSSPRSNAYLQTTETTSAEPLLRVV